MATYLELSAINRDNVLLDKIIIAVGVAADTILDGNDSVNPPWDQTNNLNRLIWAKGAFSNPTGIAKKCS